VDPGWSIGFCQTVKKSQPSAVATFIEKEDCPLVMEHSEEPEGYLQWHAWAAKRIKTHRQIRCKGCSLLVIWVPRKKRPKK